MKSALRLFVLVVTASLIASQAYAAGTLRPVWGNGLQGNEQLGGGFKVSVGLTNSVTVAIPISIAFSGHQPGKGANAYAFAIQTNHKEIDLQAYVAAPGWGLVTVPFGPSTLIVSGFRLHVPKSSGTTPVFTVLWHVTGTDNTDQNSLVNDWVVLGGGAVHFGDLSQTTPNLSTTVLSNATLSIGIDHIRPVSVEDKSWGRIKDLYRE